MISKDHSLVIGPFYDKLQTLVNSPLYECFKIMPKPALHHVHLTACASLDYLVDLTYKDCVYYSQRENSFHVSEKGCNMEGYIKVNTLRQYWKNAAEFDKFLRGKMALRPPSNIKEDHAIWKDFQHKFAITFKLYNYKPFFERILYTVSRDFVREMCTVIEYRHIFGCVFDDDGNVIPLEEEIQIFKDCEQKIQQRFPLFRMRLIICGLKMFGNGHI